MDEKEGNPFDDSYVMAPDEKPREDASVDPLDTGDAVPSSESEPPAQGIQRSTTFPARVQDDTSADSANRRRGQTFSSQRLSVEPDRLDSIQEDRPLGRPLQNGGGSVRSTRSPGTAAGARDRNGSVSVSQVSRRRPRGLTIPRAATIFRRPTLVPTATSSSVDRQDAQGGGFTLAGAETTQAAQNQPYVDPMYAQLNPAYVQPTNTRPVWGLAKPLPRVLRPGMVPTPSELNVPRPDNASQGGDSRADNLSQSQPDLDDLERGQPSLRRAGTFSNTSNLRTQRENRLLQRQTTHGTTQGATSEAHISTDDLGGRSTTGPSEPFPAFPTPIAEEPREDYFNPDFVPTYNNNRRYSYQPSADRQNANKYDDNASETTEVENDEDWPALTPYGIRLGDPDDEVHNHHTHWSIVRTRYREPLAEFLAAFIQLTIAFCATIAVTVADNANNFSVNFAWGFATMVGIYIAGGISGAHLNPAISIMLWVYRGFPLRKIPPYIFAQLLAAFLAALLTFGLYRSAILEYSGALSLSAGGTANSFITSRRASTVDPATAFFNEFVATAFLAATVLALGDDSNAPPGAGMSALVLGLVITVLCMAFGYNTGAAMNPARDFGPRLALLAVGYKGVFSDGGYWVYGPWAATISGAIAGGGLYDVAIFVGGESPINYPRKRMWRAGHKFKKRMAKRIKRENIPDTLR